MCCIQAHAQGMRKGTEGRCHAMSLEVEKQKKRSAHENVKHNRPTHNFVTQKAYFYSFPELAPPPPQQMLNSKGGFGGGGGVDLKSVFWQYIVIRLDKLYLNSIW